jgi:hypothetical protein
MENQKLHLECEVSRPDKPAQWFKDDKPVSVSARIRLKSDGGVHSLDIDSADLDDEGIYKVVVNGAESSAEVLVEGMLLVFSCFSFAALKHGCEQCANMFSIFSAVLS